MVLPEQSARRDRSVCPALLARSEQEVRRDPREILVQSVRLARQVRKVQPVWSDQRVRRELRDRQDPPDLPDRKVPSDWKGRLVPRERWDPRASRV